ncbi:MAG: iron ABC transporter permease [Spirochaetales bacterium]|nr:iron ABC transporter permease [Spirochaetales bacterium]
MNNDQESDRRFNIVALSFGLLLVLLFMVSLFSGRYSIPPGLMCRVLLSKVIHIDMTWSRTVETVIFNIRLPRTVLAALIGGSLAVCGASFQGMFQNPLVSPDILGVTSGAGFGAALAILLWNQVALIQASAFIFGILAVFIAYIVSRVFRPTPTLMLVLSGIIVGSIFSALLSLIKYVADPNQKLPAIVFWLMGSLAGVSKKELVTVAIPILVGTAGLFLVRWLINILSMGDEEAHSMGIRSGSLKLFIIVCATIVTASSVSACGIIGWVGLVVPHICRMIIGSNHTRLIPLSFLGGGCFLLGVDTIARTVISAEIPLGILTALIGAPFFAFLLRKTGGKPG